LFDNLADTYNDFLISITDNIPYVDLVVVSDLMSNLNESTVEPFIVSEYAVYEELCKLNVRKATCEPTLSNRQIIEFAEILAAPVCAIINSSFRQCCVPWQWKHSKIVPIPKIRPPASIESDLHPISITSPLAKVAERFMGRYFNEHFNNLIDHNQFGCTANRSTTIALLKLTEELYRCSENFDNIVRILFVDFSKAFDKVNHNVLLHKFIANHFPLNVTLWSIMFLSNRTQYVSIGDLASNTLISHAGTPQGTIAGPNDFKLLINDLNFNLTYIKYVDDVSCLSVSVDPLDNSLQAAADHLITWCDNNGMLLNVNKTKEMIIYFGKRFNKSICPPLSIRGKQIERVSVFKLLGVVFSSDLSWQQHVNLIL
jgi:hypothetical protein